MQKSARGYIVTDSFAHGISTRRVRRFTKSFEPGTISGGDTFSAEER
ncbi:MAG TPA: neutral zinc metallopeptidase [Spirochaetota bacterium]|nr:neutral zinc metallopeptidase [Spirochaetota bacterium]